MGNTTSVPGNPEVDARVEEMVKELDWFMGKTTRGGTVASNCGPKLLRDLARMSGRVQAEADYHYRIKTTNQTDESMRNKEKNNAG